jgi:[acyl-carrier-protein] S-malonyltransferase
MTMTIDPKTTAFVFPGQGSQAVGMGRDLAAAFPEARQAFEEADDMLGFRFPH